MMALVVLAMSGGVDSSAAAHLLLEAGHEVVGVFMRHGEAAVAACAPDGRRENSPLLPILERRSDHKQGCCSSSDARDGRRVADRLGIPFYALDLQREFAGIVDYFITEYATGRTPNPCVMCNNRIKFGTLFDYADGIGAEFVATGHYARLARIAGSDEPALLRGVDARKDQSYVLFGVARHRLRRMLLPVGHYGKTAIRALARNLGLETADKKDSQEICFVTSGQHDAFVRHRRPDGPTAGEIVTLDGRVVGHHDGIESFTVGQRRIGVAMGEPFFVVRIEPDTHRVVIGGRSDLAVSRLRADDVNWLADPPAGRLFQCLAQTRYNSPPGAARGEILPDGDVVLTFESPQTGIAPGQAAVWYDGDRVLGGGWIRLTEPAARDPSGPGPTLSSSF
jgi:tRNA-specific 2-thiouridylase